MRVTVTGGNGYLGSAVVDALLDTGAYVTVLDLAAPAPVPSGSVVRYVRGSILDADAVARSLRADPWGPDGPTTEPDAVVHLAGLTHDRAFAADPAGARRINVDACLALAEAAREAGVRRFVMASSGAVYGGTTTGPLDERSPLDPIGPYAESKADAEHLLGSVVGIDLLVLRIPTLWGPAPVTRADVGVHRMITAAAGHGRITIEGDPDQYRPFLRVRGAANELTAALAMRLSGVLNLGVGAETLTVACVADRVARAVTALTGREVAVERRAQAGPQTSYRTDTSALRTALAAAASLRLVPPGLVPPVPVQPGGDQPWQGDVAGLLALLAPGPARVLAGGAP